MLAQLTFYKSTSKDLIPDIMPVLHSIISNIFDAMFQQMHIFLIKTDMESVANITKTLMEKNSIARSNES